MRKIAAGLVCAAFVSGCVTVSEDKRIDRGPVLRTFERSAVRESGGVQASVRATWPELTLTFSEFDLCRLEKVEEYVEDVTTERNSPAFGPALSLGAPATLVGAGLLIASGLFSNEPDLSRIDGGGRYGAPPRQQATAWGIGLLGVGIPALAVAVVGYLRSGSSTESRRVEDVASAVETPCHARKVNGEVAFLGEGKTPSAKKTENGSVTFNASELRGNDFDTVLLNGRSTVAVKDDAAALAAFGACLEVLPPPGGEVLAKKSVAAIQDLIASAQACAAVPNAPAADVVHLLEDELSRRVRSADGGF